MSFVCFLLFIFVTAPDPEAGGAKRSRQGCEEQQTLGLRGKSDEQTFAAATDTSTIPWHNGFGRVLSEARQKKGTSLPPQLFPLLGYKDRKS